jgi:hypothetical protein
MFLFPKPQKKTIGFEDVKIALKNPTRYILINTLPSGEQDVLIRGTLAMDREETVLNAQLNDYNAPDLPVIVYGRNSCDASADAKQTQLRNLGVTEVYVYAGGLFEWLLLQDAYGADEFPTVNGVMAPDPLRYRAKTTFS